VLKLREALPATTPDQEILRLAGFVALIVLASAWRTAIMGALMQQKGHPVHLILSPGTRIVTRNDANRIGGGQVIPAGAVAVVVKSPR
jgi:hypothetical protein